MTEHEPECWCRGCTHPHVCGRCRNCICDELRACEQRVLDAAREAVAKQKLVPFAKQGRFIITRNTKLWDQRQAWSELGWWDFRDSALAAIDALKEDNDQRSQAEGVEL